MSDKIIKYDNLEHGGFDGGGTEILLYNGKPFTGIMYDEEKDGSLAFEIEYQDGYLEGKTIYFYPNGKVQEEYVSHNNDVVEGTYRRYDEEGNITGKM